MESVQPRYELPPIVEVICGVWYSSLTDLDPMLMGAYWASRKSEYPHREVRTIVESTAGLRLHRGVAPVRAWLVSADKSTVVQLQHDRFYLNWRRVEGGSYPSFSDPQNGLRRRAIDEYEQFSEYCKENLGAEPNPMRVEVGKVDHIAWHTVADWSQHMPVLSGLLSVVATDRPQTAFGVAGTVGETEVRVQITTATVAGRDAEESVVRLETTALHPARAGDLAVALNEANRAANQVFNDLIPEGERDKRYRRKV